MSPPAQIDAADVSGCDAQPVGPMTRRLVYALALIPIVPAVSVFVTTAPFMNRAPIAGFDELRWLHLFLSIFWVLATIYIWRSAILWTLGRKWLTALVSLIPFVQVVYAQPLWNTGGCLAGLTDGALRFGQHEIGLGLWIWITIWVWWGWEKRQMATVPSVDSERAIRMSPSAKCLAASIGSIPFLVGRFFVISVALDDLLDVSDRPAEPFAITSFLAVIVWILIWRRAVVWSAVVVRRTVVAALAFFALPIAAQFLFWRGAGDLLQMILPSSAVAGWGLWMAVTVRMWPSRSPGAYAADATPRCLRCGYLLIGLRATRCPECGDEPTLDELWQATAGDGL